jgi:SAM-dependent methyltransferase
MKSRQPAWADYVNTFHTQLPGITEEILARCSDETGATPYAWLTDGLDPEAQVVDLACGSGPTRALVAGKWVGVDCSSTELSCALERGRATLVRADVTNVPIRSDTADAVLCSMALMLIDPCFAVLDEIRRILSSAGELRALLPATRPLTASDRLHYLRLFATARSRPRFPMTALRRHATDAFAASGLVITSDQSRRFGYPIATPADVDRFIESWYRPDKPPGRADPRRRRCGSPTTIGVPLRRIIARPTTRSNPSGNRTRRSSVVEPQESRPVPRDA